MKYNIYFHLIFNTKYLNLLCQPTKKLQLHWMYFLIPGYKIQYAIQIKKSGKCAVVFVTVVFDFVQFLLFLKYRSGAVVQTFYFNMFYIGSI